MFSAKPTEEQEVTKHCAKGKTWPGPLESEERHSQNGKNNYIEAKYNV